MMQSQIAPIRQEARSRRSYATPSPARTRRNISPRSRFVRLERLDAKSPVALVWVDFHETQEDALARRFGAGPRPLHVMFIGWSGRA
jgi:hypothetical protein